MERVGREEKLDRELYLLDVSRAEEVAPQLRAPPRRFDALIMWDAVAASVAKVSRVVEALMSAGCVTSAHREATANAFATSPTKSTSLVGVTSDPRCM